MSWLVTIASLSLRHCGHCFTSHKDIVTFGVRLECSQYALL